MIITIRRKTGVKRKTTKIDDLEPDARHPSMIIVIGITTKMNTSVINIVLTTKFPRHRIPIIIAGTVIHTQTITIIITAKMNIIQSSAIADKRINGTVIIIAIRNPTIIRIEIQNQDSVNLILLIFHNARN